MSAPSQTVTSLVNMTLRKWINGV